jgi:drug/metabolite transporter (DMT)-like permease
MTPEQTGELAAIGTALLWTLSALAWTSAGRHVGAVAVSFLRLVIAIVLLMAYGQIVRGLPLPTGAAAERWLILGLSGVMGFLVCDLCLFKAFLLIGPRLSLLIFSLAPPLAALLGRVFLADVLLPRHWLGMAVTLAGIVWVVLEQPQTEPHPHQRRQLQQGIFLAAVAAAAGAAGYVLSKRGIGDYDAVAATLIRIFGAVAGYVLCLTIFRRWRPVLAAAGHGRAMVIISLGAVVGPCVGVALSMEALRQCPAGVVATILATMPVLILPCTILLYGERVSLRAAAGAVISVAGIALLML